MAVALHDKPRFAIYFGDARDGMYPSQYHQWELADLMGHSPAQAAAQALPCDQLFFLAQVHGVDGALVTAKQAKRVRPFSIKGDFLMTNEPFLGIGIMTADCLPVICYDTQHCVAGIAHAGWRGAVAGVVEAMLKMMHKQCGTILTDTLFFFGPSAKRCCYEVDDMFERQFSSYPFYSSLFERGNGVNRFDLPGFVWNRLMVLGVEESQICLDYNVCTICDHRFCSHRRATREGTASKEGRQMTVVVVK